MFMGNNPFLLRKLPQYMSGLPLSDVFGSQKKRS